MRLATLAATASLGILAAHGAHADVYEAGTFTALVSSGTDAQWGGATVGSQIYGTMSVDVTSYSGSGGYGFGTWSSSMTVTYAIAGQTITQNGGSVTYNRTSPCCDTISAMYSMAGSTLALSNFDVPGVLGINVAFATTTGTINLSSIGLMANVTAFEIGKTAIPPPAATPVPEPPSAILLGCGLLGVGLVRRHRPGAASACLTG